MANKTIHVIHRKSEGDWKVQKGGAERASAICSTKKEAVQKAEQIAKNQGLETKIHNMDGKISGGNSYGNDPCPPKDKK